MSGAHHSVEYLKELYAELHQAEHVRHIKYIVNIIEHIDFDLLIVVEHECSK